MGKRIVIVGGVAGGASAAARLRRLDEEAEIVLLERGPYISFANCGLPYYIGGSIRDRAKLLVQTPEMMRSRFRLDVRVESEALRIDTQRKQVLVRSREQGEYEETYDALILSPGAKPIRPPIPGIEHPGILTLRSIPDTDRIKDWVDREATRSAVIIGGGYIGIEMAENLAQRGLEVTVVEAAPHILAPFDDDMAVIAEQELREHGVRLLLGDAVAAFGEAAGPGGAGEPRIAVTLKSGRAIAADLAILAIGVQPDTDFLRGSGIELGARGHIRVDAGMRTNAADVYAVGDAVETALFGGEREGAVPLAGPANKQGRIAADNICGLPSRYGGTQGTAILRVFDLTGACTGENARSLRQRGVPHQAVHVHPASHAGYYPGASAISMKLLFDAQGRILGAQAFGREGVDKRIDVVATAMRLGGTVQDLANLELSYAPPYSSAKDPVNMAGFVAGNVLAGRMDVLLPEQLNACNPDANQLVDVRTAQEFREGAIPGAVNIPLDELRERMGELHPDKEIWIYCQVGLRGYLAASLLNQRGFRTRNLSGGFKTYSMMQP